MRINDFNATGFDSVIEPSLIAKFENGSDSATLIEKSITENGEYNASADNADGYSSVTVNVAAPTPETFEINFSYNLETGNPESDKTFAEAQEAISENKRLVLIFHWPDDEGGTIDFTFVSYTYSEHLITFTREHFTDEITISLLYWCDSEYHIERGSSNISLQNVHVRPNA